jgi:hypothetical protein
VIAELTAFAGCAFYIRKAGRKSDNAKILLRRAPATSQGL